jgi:Holliday junction resolvase RusA-like endonuclease
MIIILPLPPSVNSLFGGGSGQKRFPSKKYKEWMKLCEHITTDVFNAECVSMRYTFFWPDNRARDLSNRIKAAEDFIVKRGVIKDDCWQVVSRIELISGGIDKQNPRVEVYLECA